MIERKYSQAFKLCESAAENKSATPDAAMAEGIYKIRFGKFKANEIMKLTLHDNITREHNTDGELFIGADLEFSEFQKGAARICLMVRSQRLITPSARDIGPTI